MINKSIIETKKVFIFDMDGTLYSQKKMRIGMATNIIKALIRNPSTINEVFIVMKFRRYREKDKFKDSSLDDLYNIIAKQKNVRFDYAKNVLEKWMFLKPLELLNSCGYLNIIKYINTSKSDGKIILIYSDYPAEAKIKALGIDCDKIYVPGIDLKNELKPSATIMHTILKDIELLGYSNRDVLYVGDRDEKDRVSAEIINVDYLDIKDLNKMIYD